MHTATTNGSDTRRLGDSLGTTAALAREACRRAGGTSSWSGSLDTDSLGPPPAPDPDRPRRLATWWAGPYGRRLVGELVLCLALFFTYRSIRMITRDDASAAFANARDVMQWERAVGIFTEERFQDTLLGNEGLIALLNRYYVTVHFIATSAFLVWAFLRHRQIYSSIRAVFIAVTASALVIHVLVPLAPPRMFPGSGFVDTLRVYGPRIYSTDVSASVANQFAALPSLHFGWAVLVAGGYVAIRRSWRSLVAFVHPLVTLVAIVATGNHYWFDALIALGLVLGAWVSVALVQARRHRRAAPSTEPEGDPARTLVPDPS